MGKKIKLFLLISSILLILFNVFFAKNFEWSYLINLLFIVIIPVITFIGYRKGIIKKEKLQGIIVFSILILLISIYFLLK